MALRLGPIRIHQPGMASGRTPISATELEMPIVQHVTFQKLAGPAARTEPRGHNAVDQLPDCPPFIRGDSWVESRVLGFQARLATLCLHTDFPCSVQLTVTVQGGPPGARDRTTVAGSQRCPDQHG
jgi:hypothetical protein